MTLPAPNLDDRRFQDLVDEAKRMIQRKWPEWTGWTDHNVSDPGVTLIETFAFMVDQLVYRLNRVPDRTYIKLLDLIGLRLQPPTAASAPVTFWLTAPRPDDVIVAKGTEVATERTDAAEALVFRTAAELDIIACQLSSVASSPAAGEAIDVTDSLSAGQDVLLFSPRPSPGDSFYVGLSNAVPSCVVAVRFLGQVEGYGINPDRAPRLWQAWDGAQWIACEIERDETGGFNRAGVVVLHVPAGHTASTIASKRGGWLRCVVTAPAPGENPYDASPRVERIEAFTVGGTVAVIHGEEVHWETIGVSEGVAGQEFQLQHGPVVLAPDEEVIDAIVESSDSGDLVASSEEWTRVDGFASCGPDDRVFTIEPVTGTVRFGPALREPDGTIRRYGAVPPVGAVLRVRTYRTGGGRAGNVAAHAIRSLRSSLPSIHSVENRIAATGGVDAEGIEEAKQRGPLMLRTRDRAVTAADFEHLAREAAPEIARVTCPDVTLSEPGLVRVLVVPRVDDSAESSGRLRFDQLRPSDETFERIAESLEERRVIGVRVVVEPPSYQGLTVVARLRAKRNAAVGEVERLASQALYRYYHPVVGGPAGTGWPFGRPVQAAEVYAVLQGVPGVDYVQESLLFIYNVATGERGQQAMERIDLPPTSLVFSYAHDVTVEPTL